MDREVINKTLIGSLEEWSSLCEMNTPRSSSWLIVVRPEILVSSLPSTTPHPQAQDALAAPLSPRGYRP